VKNDTERSLSQIAKIAASYGLAIGAVLLLFRSFSGAVPFWEGAGMILGGAFWAVLLAVPILWIIRKLFKT